MKRKLLTLHIFFFVSYFSFSQNIGIGTNNPDASAILDITAVNKGLAIPRMITSSINAIPHPVKGLLAYDSVINQLMINIGTPLTPDWQPVGSGWGLNGNNGTNPLLQFIGTTDNQPLRFRINNSRAGELDPEKGNIFWGLRAGQANTAGFSNVAIGSGALALNTNQSNLVAIGDSALFHNSQGSSLPGEALFNTALGSKSLFSNTKGSNNTATGMQSLFSNTTGDFNTGYGSASLTSNKTGNDNTAVGNSSMFSNISGRSNAAMGSESLFFNTTGDANTATGSESLRFNTTGNANTATGFQSLFSNTTGTASTATGVQSLFLNINGANNTADGKSALFSNTMGSNNTAVGNESVFTNGNGSGNSAVGNLSLRFNSTGNNNTALGDHALFGNSSGSQNIGIGAFSLSVNDNGNSNTALGFGADVSAGNLSNATAIGVGAIVNASNKIRLGNGAVTVIEGQVPFTTPSDGRFKYQIKENVKGLDFIMQLRPVTYQFDAKRFDEQQRREQNDTVLGASSGIIQSSYQEAIAIRRSGFIAQEVEKAASASGYDFSGLIRPKNEKDHYSLSYESFVVPLVKSVQEQQKIILKQQQILEYLEKENADLQKRICVLEKK